MSGPFLSNSYTLTALFIPAPQNTKARLLHKAVTYDTFQPRAKRSETREL